MANKRQSKCQCCGEIFEVDVRNRGRQKYCPKGACRRAGKTARQRRWLEKPENQDYFSGPEHVDRVRVWRAAHPGYWRSPRRQQTVHPGATVLLDHFVEPGSGAIDAAVSDPVGFL